MLSYNGSFMSPMPATGYRSIYISMSLISVLVGTQLQSSSAHTPVVDIEKISLQLDESEQSLALPRSMASRKGRTESVSRVLPAEFKKVYLPAAGVLLALTSGVCGYWFGAKKTIVPQSQPSASIPAVPKPPEVDVQA